MRTKVSHHRRKCLKEVVRSVEFASRRIGPDTDASALARHPIQGMPQMVCPIQSHHPDGSLAEFG